ncbi:MAG: NAD(P)-dependent alcohol dehydrogenase [Rhizorhabdus sp.]|jgi:NADPH:quinone reductase-like Zn-dependent oxidoreductase|nr:MAG: NAD(P)-dependent alcohol dehydrogenase [Rhizorhabdus sp.]
MRSLKISAPWGLDRLEIVDAPTPEPGPGQVRVRMKAAALNYRDLVIMQGRHVRGALSEVDIIPLGDGCGIVEAVGDQVTRFSIGQRVVPMMLPRWESGPPAPWKMEKGLGMNLPGVGRDQAVFSEEALVAAPEFLTDVEAACLACAGVTAWSALFGGAPLTPGATVLLQGTGGVAMFALQFAKAAGLRVIMTSSSDEKLERARALGADHGINYAAEPAWSETARALTNGRGVDLVMEMGGAGSFEESLRAIRLNGQISVVGVLGPPSPLSTGALLASAARVRAVTVGSREMFEAMCHAVEFHRIRPVIGDVFALEDYQAAIAALQSTAHVGKVVLEF